MEFNVNHPHTLTSGLPENAGSGKGSVGRLGGLLPRLNEGLRQNGRTQRGTSDRAREARDGAGKSTKGQHCGWG